jgi:DNA replication protein DnaC
MHDSEQDWVDYHDKLKKTGYAALPNCPKCYGSGHYYGHADGKINYQDLKMCKYKGCLADSFAQYKSGESYLKMIGLNPDQTLASFRQEIGTDRAYAAFYYMVHPEEMTDKRRRPFLLCYGVPGNGKTHLCNAAGLGLNEQKIGVRMYAVPDMVSELWQGMKDHTTELRIEFLKSIPALILDDYGVNFGAPMELSWLDTIICSRYKDEKITIMTMNKDLSYLDCSDTKRIYSRFTDSYLSIMALNKGLDQRPMQAAKKVASTGNQNT